MEQYAAMPKEALVSEKERLLAEYQRYVQMNLKLDMSRGKPAPAQLDLSLPMLKEDAVVDAAGVDTRNYGQLEGTPEARRFFAEMLGAAPEDTLVGGASSLQLMFMFADIGWRSGFGGQTPWKDVPKRKFLCPSPGYDRHFRITEVLGFELVEVPMTPDGPDMDEVERLVQDPDVKGMWCVPLYSNPDGYCYSDETVRRMAAMKTAPDFRIFWDNAYGFHHLTDEPVQVLNILDECRKAGCEDRALMFISTSKITFAGAGVGATAASSANLKALQQYLFPQLITFDKVNQLRHVRYLRREGGVAAHMKKHAALIKPKFDMVEQKLAEGLEDLGVARWTNPKGGYFISFYAMEGCAARIVQLCKEAGVVLTGAGAAFPYGKDPKDTHIRIAPTFPPLEEVQTAIELLCVATRLACAEKLLSE